MERKPEPLTPVDADLRDLPSMLLDVDRLLRSASWITATGDEAKAMMSLWAASWHEVPAGSLPNDDRMLAHLSLSGTVEAWHRYSSRILTAWIECSDGRLYHPVVCEKVLEQIAVREKKSLAGKVGAAKRWGTRVKKTVENHNDGVENHNDGDAIAVASRRHRSANAVAIAKNSKRSGSGSGSGREEEQKQPPPSPPSGEGGVKNNTYAHPKKPDERVSGDFNLTPPEPKVKRKPKVNGHHADGFEDFWRIYPRKQGKVKAAEAWDRIAPDPALCSRIVLAVEQARCTDQWVKEGGKFVPWPATWLNGKRWEDELVVDVGGDPYKASGLVDMSLTCDEASE